VDIKVNVIRERMSDPVRRRRLPLTRQAGADQSAPSTFSADLKFAFGILRQKRRLILRTIGLAMLVALAYIWITPPLYTATAQVLLDPRKREIVNKEIVSSGLGSSSLGADTFLLDSEVEVMISEGVRRALIEKLSLEQDPEFGGTSGNVLTRAVKYVAKLVLRGPQAIGAPETSAMDRALKVLDQHMHVNREGNTYVINVRVSTEDPAKSATIANAMTDIYIQESISAARKRVEEAETLLSGRLEELRRAALDAQAKVEAFRVKNGLIATDNTPLVEQELRDINQQLTVAAANTSRALARWKEVGKLRTMTFEEALSAGSIQSTLLQTLQDRYAAIVAQEASLATSLKARHPNLIAVRDSKAALKREISAELARLVSRTKVDYDVAVANEAAIKSRLATAKAVTAETNQAAIALKELEQDAQAAASIYQEFLGRSKDAREQVTLPLDSARVISAAFPPTRASWPKEPLLLAFALFAGLVAGIVLAFLSHILGGTKPSEPRRGLGVTPQQTA
jgi:succinoglycan biosynthesis transport protein ExoP